MLFLPRLLSLSGGGGAHTRLSTHTESGGETGPFVFSSLLAAADDFKGRGGLMSAQVKSYVKGQG